MQILTPERKQYLLKELQTGIANRRALIEGIERDFGIEFKSKHPIEFEQGFRFCLSLLETLDAEPAGYVFNPQP